MNVLVTGSAGFIGAHVVRMLTQYGGEIVGVDNLDSYYDTNMKLDRLAWSGISTDPVRDGTAVSPDGHYRFYRADICDQDNMRQILRDHDVSLIFHLAAQAGVRHSLEKPLKYVHNNILGFATMVEAAVSENVRNIIYASSSSVYGDSKVVPYTEDLPVNRPLSIYAATKSANELYAYAASSLNRLVMTGVRFFTVFGPWGRPDMAYYLFADKIMKGETIRLRGNGNMRRDHTFIDDVVEGLRRLYEDYKNKSANTASSFGEHTIYNIGYGQPVSTHSIVLTLEALLEKKAIVEYVDEQQGEPLQTYADSSKMETHYGFLPRTDFQAGMKAFTEWYLRYTNGHGVQERKE